jgi:ABC-type glycerol-3-phosphate transport system substrate-binding protein
MKRRYRSLLAFALAAVLASCSNGGGTSGGSGNGSGGDDDSINPDKTQLYVGNYYGGLGDAWLRELADRFEETHDDVQVVIDNSKTNYLPDTLINTISTMRQSVYFVDNAYYYDLVSQNKIADITDIVTEPLTEYGETKSIEDKLPDTLKTYYKNSYTGDKYYGLPTYQAQYGWVYDIDLFEDKKLFFGETSTDAEYVWTDGKDGSVAKWAGQDGESGTYDDGLPVTIQQFYDLCERMKQMNITPFIWTGKFIGYTMLFMRAYWANYEGFDNYMLNYTFSGSEVLNGDSEATEITPSNAYELQRQTGKLRSLEFAKWVFSDSYNYASSSVTTTNDHIAAQKEFIWSYPTNKPIAMLCDGDWWENEARESGAFTTMVSKYGDEWAYGTRRFGYMTMPQFDEGGHYEENTILSTSSNALFFINANCDEEHLSLAKEFLRFCHTDEALRTFTRNTGVFRPFDYELTDEEMESLTPFSKTLYEIYHSPRTRMVYDLNRCDLRIQNAQYFRDEWPYYSSVGGAVYQYPFQAFANNPSLTADDYFKGLYDYQSGRWSRFGL